MTCQCSISAVCLQHLSPVGRQYLIDGVDLRLFSLIAVTPGFLYWTRTWNRDPSSEQSNLKFLLKAAPVSLYEHYAWETKSIRSVIFIFSWRLNISAEAWSGMHTCFYKHLHTCKHRFRTLEQVTNMDPRCHWLLQSLCFLNESPAFTSVINTQTWTIDSLQSVLWCNRCWIATCLPVIVKWCQWLIQ